MDEKFLKRYNNAQRRELQRVYDEIKWYVGEKLGKDPDKVIHTVNYVFYAPPGATLKQKSK